MSSDNAVKIIEVHSGMFGRYIVYYGRNWNTVSIGLLKYTSVCIIWASDIRRAPSCKEISTVTRRQMCLAIY